MLTLIQYRFGRLYFVFGLACLVSVSNAFGQDRYDVLEVEGDVYRNVVVRSSNASSLVISDSKGIPQLPLSKLPRTLQEKYGYDSHSDANRKAELELIRQAQIDASKQRLDRKRAEAETASVAEKGASSRGYVAFGGKPEPSRSRFPG